MRDLCGQAAREWRSTTQGKSKSGEINNFEPTTHTTSTSASGNTQQRDQLAAQQVLRFGVGEFAGLVVKSSWPESRSTLRAEPTKACNMAPFQEVGAD